MSYRRLHTHRRVIQMIRECRIRVESPFKSNMSDKEQNDTVKHYHRDMMGHTLALIEQKKHLRDRLITQNSIRCDGNKSDRCHFNSNMLYFTMIKIKRFNDILSTMQYLLVCSSSSWRRDLPSFSSFNWHNNNLFEAHNLCPSDNKFT